MSFSIKYTIPDQEAREAEQQRRDAQEAESAAIELQALRVRAKATTWAELHAAMAATVARPRPDQETNHIDADDLLCVALLKARPDLAHFVRTYLTSPKWYA
jgi:hypothetical protein